MRHFVQNSTFNDMFLVIKTVLFVGIALIFSSIEANKRVKCPPFPHAFLEHGKILSFPSNHELLFQCEPGYFLNAPEVVRCFRGNWTSLSQPTCERNGGFCEDPDGIDKAVILGDNRHTDSVVRYFCEPGFVLVGEAERVCLNNGYWSGIKPTCMDVNEPIEKVAERLKSEFVTNISSYSTDSGASEAKFLDSGSLQRGLELVILIDRSSSIDPIDFNIGIGFVKFLLRKFGVNNQDNTFGTRVAVITFGTKVNILFNLDNATISSPSKAEKALDTLEANGGGTAMEEAFMTIFTNLPSLRNDAKKAIFLITDGEPNIGSLNMTLEFSKLLRQVVGYEIFVVGIGGGTNRQILAKLASDPPFSHVFVLEKYPDLNDVIKIITDDLPKPAPISRAKCGYIGNPEMNLKKWPWLAAIYIGFLDDNNSTYFSFCTGTLICSQWVLTAASCFYRTSSGRIEKAQLREIFVVLGERNLVNPEKGQTNYYAVKLSIHPDFTSMEDLQNNLAVIKLNIPAQMGRYRPACLPPADLPMLLHKQFQTNASIAGWGVATTNNVNVINGATVNFLRSNFTVKIEEENVCNEISGRAAKETVFCAGFGMMSCVGNIGSPLIAVDPSTHLHHVIGVLSKKTFCQDGINQYLELTRYIEWIGNETKHCPEQHFKA